MSIIVGDLPAMTTEDYAEIDDCLQDAFGNPIASCGYVDDILISFELSPVDGPGGTLAYSGPLYTRDPALPGKQLPLSGFIALDIADWQQMLQEGTLQPVLEHEMAHVLGFGTLWKDKNLIRPLDCEAHAAAGDLQSASYAGRAARSSMVRIGFDAATPPPVESQGGIGRACGHWREASMYTELMTGLISPAGTRNPLSMLTALSFRDMGYAVDERSGGIDMFSRRAGRARSGMVQRPVGDCLGKFRGAKKARRRDGQA
ncbi:hypothetical protein DFJ74DRAFT_676229 [Hyaloraphidium curvatum]|nr:hypothetical protein DFJ74DRAFT_676229 [Hyaloraphidium curvatum]